MIRLDGVTKRYPGGNEALRDVSLDVFQGADGSLDAVASAASAHFTPTVFGKASRTLVGLLQRIP